MVANYLPLRFHYFLFHIKDINLKYIQLQKEIKNIIEPILFSWIKENMPDITKEVLTEVVKENNKNKIEAMLATWIQENMTNITKDILLEVVKKNKIDKRLVSEEFHESE